MTASSPSGSAQVNSPSNTSNKPRQQNQVQQATTDHPIINSSSVFQQIKHTQASLARLSRVHQQLHANNSVNSNNQHNHAASSATGNNANSQQSHQLGDQSTQSSQQQANKSTTNLGSEQNGQLQHKPTTFVDCLIRRFKNCFNEDFCTVPMFVVGNLSPGSDGTHLILPPCVSLGGQSINRFSSPKNLRLMNSIRESCHSIEELDLGGNRLTDLIEVYKILQCTPNLRFLNLSENDLSRTVPVAMASISTASTGSTTTLASGLSTYSTYSTSSSIQASASANFNTVSTPSQRNFLAPLNQNTSLALSARRHSTLGQTSARSPVGGPSSGVLRKDASRVAEARRMAAANALAQSKKTSSSVASKLAHSHQANAQASSSRARDGQAKIALGNRLASGQRNQATATSTMHLARSLSSLSAKDLRASNSSLSRLSSHHRANNMRCEARNSISSNSMRRRTLQQHQQVPLDGNEKKQSRLDAESDVPAKETGITASLSHQKLYAEPIAENEDVDMNSEQQSSANCDSSASQIHSTSYDNNQQAQHAASSGSSINISNNNKSSAPAAGYTGLGSSMRATICGQSNTQSQATNTAQATSYTGSQMNSFRRTFGSIKALALNNTGCQWKVVCSILSRMPNLEELHLSLNNYEKIDLEPNEFKHLSLRRLYLCNNPKLTNWEELDKLLIAFPSLEALSIANCSISQIPENLDRAREWRKLCGLNINGWPIKEWPVVERLNQLPSLIDLRCRNLEVLNSIDEPRHHLIARLPKLQRLNGSEIEEREEAEKAFIRFFMANSHLERPSRFHELMKIYGEISAVDVDVDLSPPSQAQVRIVYLDRSHYRKENNDDIMMSEDFLLKLMDFGDNGSSENNVIQQEQQSSTIDNAHHQSGIELEETSTISADTSKPVRLFKDEGQEILALNVDLRQSVRKFKSNLAELFGLNGQNLILYYIDHEMVGLMGPELLKYNQKKLWNYNVQDGDQFIVEKR